MIEEDVAMVSLLLGNQFHKSKDRFIIGDTVYNHTACFTAKGQMEMSSAPMSVQCKL